MNIGNSPFKIAYCSAVAFSGAARRPSPEYFVQSQQIQALEQITSSPTARDQSQYC